MAAVLRNFRTNCLRLSVTSAFRLRNVRSLSTQVDDELFGLTDEQKQVSVSNSDQCDY